MAVEEGKDGRGNLRCFKFSLTVVAQSVFNTSHTQINISNSHSRIDLPTACPRKKRITSTHPAALETIHSIPPNRAQPRQSSILDPRSQKRRGNQRQRQDKQQRSH
jgi:hypothetical protein